MSTPQTETASRFRALHVKGNLLLLPNGWDAASARVAEDCGAKAVATSSAAVAWSHGYADGEALPKEILLSTVREIVRVVKVPVSADSEGGYSQDLAEVASFVVALARAGAVGINLEDGTSPPAMLAAKIEVIRKALAREGLDVFVNARADVYLKSLVPAERMLEETLSRGRLYRDAGADGFFVPGLAEASTLHKIAETIDLPLNALTRTGLPTASALKDAGVRRISAGAGMARAGLGAMRRAALEMLNEGRYDAMIANAEGCPNLNALMKGTP